VKIETHGAVVFLAGENVYKIKRAVSYPYMDFSTLEKRKTACEAEISVNRRFAPDIYLGVVPIVRSASHLRLGGPGSVVEWAVHMRRFDETRTFDRLAEAGKLTNVQIDKLAATIWNDHNRARAHHDGTFPAHLEKVIHQILGELEHRCRATNPDRLPYLSRDLQAAYDSQKPLLEARVRAGHVRRCHGDLHLRNIVLIGGEPVLFDAIEFDPVIATIDTLYDLAFLIMDLCHRQSRSLACRLLNQYVWLDNTGSEIAGLALFPLFLALRASIRAAVLAARVDITGTDEGARREIQAYLEDAWRFLRPSSPEVVAIGGLSGSGKSTIAALLAPLMGAAPGAVHLSSDIERKRLFGVAPLTRLPPAAYDAAASRNVYRSLQERQKSALTAGRSVVMEATFLDPAFREQMEQSATEHGVPFTGIWLSAPHATLEARLHARTNDVSDATRTVLQNQFQRDIGAINWHMVDASLSPDRVTESILALVGTARPVRAAPADR
jgi:aminoglycoside phosphotransferase family enzyme/predicted kinase